MPRRLRLLPLAAGLLAGASCSVPAPPSVVIVVLDTLRRDHTGLGSTGAGASRTPHLDALAGDAAVFPHAWTTAPWTVPAHASLLTGRLPSGHGCTSLRPHLDDSLPTLAGLLADAGYETAAFFSNPWLSDEVTGLLRGFGERHAADTPGPRVGGGQDQGGTETLRNVLAWLARRDRDRPFLLFVNLLEAHAPYDPPAASRSAVAPGLRAADRVSTEWILDFQAGLTDPASVDWGRVRDLYAGDAHFADALLGDLVGLLREHVDLDETVVVVTSDHGENLGELDQVNHQFRVDETLLAVPLLVRAPGRVAPGRRDEPALLTDVFATVLELAGVDAEPPGEAWSLVASRSAEPRPVVAEYAGGPPGLVAHLARRNPSLDAEPLRAGARTVRVGDVRLTITGEGRPVLHDLAADPGQTSDVAPGRPGDAAALGEALAHALAAARREPDAAGEAPRPSGETQRKLKSLGYVQ